ncbi:rhodanese-like domain-containing protein [Salinadaptatus halalkaliphilus]|uniref:Rhodanese-like domain-containing protein n=1 Tax=Salinadaptatus halalkaliphilus TaxID=2419781 RepID=A0A4S3TSA7_9EURY|nr:rhodanese-like domain-containing protein [Salinadaptatus halalkaliphilus]THE66580.1 rhodanese-like domain-containing protein [Salinadaptatus halalkaliphilus]
MNRRTVLSAVGTASISAVAGCFGSDSSDGENPTSGEFEEPDEYETESFGERSVPFVPLETVYDWWNEDAVQLVDARTEPQYNEAHIDGAVFSPAPDGLEADDPVAAWSTETPIVTYCVCPIAQAGQRGATLLEEGYTNVYGLAGGFNPWRENGYATESNVDAELTSYEIRGQTDSVHAGETVLVREPETGQREASRIGDDGRYELSLHFVDTPTDAVVELKTPEETRKGSLEEFTDDVVRA